jgi:hypothetical protein
MSFEMSRQEFAAKIRKLSDAGTVTQQFERELKLADRWTHVPLHDSRKKDWMIWLDGYQGPTPKRKEWERSAQFIYNHLSCPPMVLWLAEAGGIPKSILIKAKGSALRAQPNRISECAAIREIIPWASIESKLTLTRRNTKA